MSFIMASPPLELSDSAPVSGFWVRGSGFWICFWFPYSILRILYFGQGYPVGPVRPPRVDISCALLSVLTSVTLSANTLMPGDNESSRRGGSFCSSYFLLPSAGSRPASWGRGGKTLRKILGHSGYLINKPQSRR